MKTNRKFMLLAAAMMTAGTMAAEGLITSVPEGGESVAYSRKTLEMYIPYNDPYMQQSTTDGFVSEIVWFDNNDVYIKSPVASYPTESYVKGVRNGNKITVTLPQLIAEDSYYGNVYAQKMKYVYNSTDKTKNYEVVSAEENVVEFEILDDGSVQLKQEELMNEFFPEYALGVTYEKNNQPTWLKYANGNDVYTKFTDTLVGLPVGANPESWVLKYDNVDREVSVAIVGNEIYIGNLYDDGLQNGYIKGTINGLQVICESGQYLGTYSRAPYYIYFMAGWMEPYTWNGGDYTKMALKDAMILYFDENKKSLTREGEYILLNKGKELLKPIVNIGNPTFVRQGDAKLSAPQDPVWKTCMDFHQDYNIGTWSFELPKYDVNNHLLPLDKYFYNIWTDGKPFELTPDRYAGVDSPMTDIPYEFSNGDNVNVVALLHTITYYFGGFNEFTIQSFYRDDEGNKYLSNRITKKTESASVEELGASEEVAVSWTDLQGRKVLNPEKGIYVKVTEYADGSRKTAKVSVK